MTHGLVVDDVAGVAGDGVVPVELELVDVLLGVGVAGVALATGVPPRCVTCARNASIDAAFAAACASA